MKLPSKTTILLVAVALLAGGAIAYATVTVTGPVSLVTSPKTLPSSSAALPLFSITLGQDAGENLSSVTVEVNKNGTTNVAGADLGAISVYQDDGDGTFDAGDLLAGTQSAVNVNATTTVETTANNAIASSTKFFVTLTTDASWSDASPADSITVTLPASGIVTSANSPTVSAVTTAAITADTTGPALLSAIAKNTGGTAAKEFGDSIELTFSEATNKPAINTGNIGSVFSLSSGHSFLDGAGQLSAGASWNSGGTVLTITLSSNSSLPTVAVGDTVTVTAPSPITDAAGNKATGSQTITGTFGEDTTGPALLSAVAKNTGGSAAKEAGDSIDLTFSEATNKPTISASNVNGVLTLSSSHSFLDGAGMLGGASWSSDGLKLTLTLSASSSLPTVAVGDTVTVTTTASVITDAAGNKATGAAIISGSFSAASGNEGGDEVGGACSNGLTNGRLYKVGDSATVYLAAACRLKPFRGAAVFHAQGRKFQNITQLPGLPQNVTISDNPVLPASGTLIKGSHATVWFVTLGNHRRGFTSADLFHRLGFNFDQVQTISDEDLNLLTEDAPIITAQSHPDGVLLKCTVSPTVYEITGGVEHPFTNADAFLLRGHAWSHIAVVDCGQFRYTLGAKIEK